MHSNLIWDWLKRPLSMSTVKHPLSLLRAQLENSRALEAVLSSRHVLWQKIGQSHHAVIWFPVCSQRHFCDWLFKYGGRNGDEPQGCCKKHGDIWAPRESSGHWASWKQPNIPGMAVGKCLERFSQDEALGHEGELFKGTKGNLTPLEFHALENLPRHSIFFFFFAWQANLGSGFSFLK